MFRCLGVAVEVIKCLNGICFIFMQLAIKYINVYLVYMNVQETHVSDNAVYTASFIEMQGSVNKTQHIQLKHVRSFIR